MGPSIDMIGKKFGRLTVIELSHMGKGGARWNTACDCGQKATVRGTCLRNGSTKSCGCWHKEIQLKHGYNRKGKRRPEYRAWDAMRQRCNNPNNHHYYRYGERGIKACSGWNYFVSFISDMGDRPSRDHSLDRINNDGHYSCGHCEECTENEWPANCRWATRKQQQRNMPRNRMLTYRGKTRPMSYWAEYSGIPYKTFATRIRREWPIKKAVETPLMEQYRR